MLDDEGDPNTVPQTNSMPFPCLNLPKSISLLAIFIIKILPLEHKTAHLSSVTEPGRHLTAKMDPTP